MLKWRTSLWIEDEDENGKEDKVYEAPQAENLEPHGTVYDFKLHDIVRIGNSDNATEDDDDRDELDV